MEKQFPVTTSKTVTISIILVRSQIDAGFLIQFEKKRKSTEKNKKENNVREEYTKLVTI